MEGSLSTCPQQEALKSVVTSSSQENENDLQSQHIPFYSDQHMR